MIWLIFILHFYNVYCVTFVVLSSCPLVLPDHCHTKTGHLRGSFINMNRIVLTRNVIERQK